LQVSQPIGGVPPGFLTDYNPRVWPLRTRQRHLSYHVFQPRHG